VDVYTHCIFTGHNVKYISYCGSNQRNLKNNDNLISDSHSYSSVGKKTKILHPTLLSIFYFQIIYFGDFYVCSSSPFLLPSPIDVLSSSLVNLNLSTGCNGVRTPRRQTNQQKPREEKIAGNEF
jgi:hypothetical protein